MPDSKIDRLAVLRQASPYFAELASAGLDTAAALPGRHDAPPDPGGDMAACQAALRAAKRAGLARVIWWELGRHGDIAASARALADWADGLLEAALAMAARLTAERYGIIKDGRFAVVALGKLGGRELNLGSDVDLLLLWQAPADAVSDGRKSVAAGEYHQQLSRMLIRLMSERTVDGECWKTDMRLRPGGDGAPICLNLDATLFHYQDYGQTWERAMLVKARFAAGDKALAEAFIDGIRPFVYKRYLDFTTVQALAEMKRRIDAQAGSHPIAAGFDVKRGFGGIREVEFVVQSMQLVHGGREPGLRLTHTGEAIAALQDAGYLSDADAAVLTTAYWGWRRIEHAVQARLGEHTHRLPEGYAGYLSQVLDLADPPAAMQGWAEAVHHIFAAQFAMEGAMEGAAESEAGEAPGFSWLHAPESERRARLAGFDAEGQERILAALARIAARLRRGLLPERSHADVDAILGHAMKAWVRDANGVQAVELFAELLSSIAGRATWVDLLAANPGVRGWLVSVLSASRFIAGHVAHDPSWLEWPLDDAKGELRMTHLLAEMSTGLAAIEAGRLTDEEALADLGRLTDQCRLTAAMAVADEPPAGPIAVGAWLADAADAAARTAMAIAVRQLDLPADFPLVALALGKHGSREMGLVSDLDMVFVLAAEDPDAPGPGGRNLREWGQRLGRRIIQHLSMAPPFGAGFAFDARLRPSGVSGVLVATLAGFSDYQRHEAETWEHQALCRARAVAGPDEACGAVMAVIDGVLALPRDHKRLAAEVVAMRMKMQEHLASREPAVINLKHDAGGLVDIEFLAQYARLAFGGSATGMMAMLQDLPAAAPAAWHEHAAGLAQAFADYRQMENVLRVQLWASVGRLPADDASPEWETLRRHAPIKDVAALRARMHQVREAFEALLGAREPETDRGLLE